jgi:hypothetical protein
MKAEEYRERAVDKADNVSPGAALACDAIRAQLRGQKASVRNSLFEEGVREALTKEGKINVHQDVIDRLVASYHG